jgi:AcrR family transcriptional regulator
MTQTLKEKTQAKIANAALALFAAHGYEATTMEAIARRARISAGNIYRYYRNKQVLFHSLIDDDFVAALARVIGQRMAAARGLRDPRARSRDLPYAFFSDESLRFAIDHRLRVVILLARAGGSRHQRFAERLVTTMCRSTLAHFRAQRRSIRTSRGLTFALTRIYRNYVATLAELLYGLARPEQIYEAVERYSRYHLVGIDSFFDPRQ